MAHERFMTEDVRRSIQDCMDCHRICVETITHCMTMGGKHAEPAHIRVMADCAQICIAAADFMLRSSDFHSRTCGVCAELCVACADSCQRIDPHDRTMSQCVEICRRCADSCRRMAGLAAA
jgi:hypothetical protein